MPRGGKGQRRQDTGQGEQQTDVRLFVHEVIALDVVRCCAHEPRIEISAERLQHKAHIQAA